MDERPEMFARLTGRDTTAGCACAEQIAAESRASDRWYPYLDRFAELLKSGNSLVRNRAVSLLAANARWDGEGRLAARLDELLRHVTDEKPITARQCIQALPEIAAARPELAPRIREALLRADVRGYRDSMRPLLEKDIRAALRQIGERIE